MNVRVIVLLIVLWHGASDAMACCAVAGRPVVNADQTVLIIWDEAAKTQHFIRQASFKTDASDLGFLIPSPTQPELAESGNEAFPYLLRLTEPETRTQSAILSFLSGLSIQKSRGGVEKSSPVRVLAEKYVAGFNAVVLEADSADALTDWLAANNFDYTPEVKDWVKPYVDQGWKITALKVAKDTDGKVDKSVAASALRMSFKTDRPLFPYREPSPTKATSDLTSGSRLLRIYFIADARFHGSLTKDKAWPSRGWPAWAGPIRPEDRKKVLEMLKLPKSTGPASWWLTEFEDRWAYEAAPADVYFTRDEDQTAFARPPIIKNSFWPTDAGIVGVIALLGLLFYLRRRNARTKTQPAS